MPAITYLVPTKVGLAWAREVDTIWYVTEHVYKTTTHS